MHEVLDIEEEERTKTRVGIRKETKEKTINKIKMMLQTGTYEATLIDAGPALTFNNSTSFDIVFPVSTIS